MKYKNFKMLVEATDETGESNYYQKIDIKTAINILKSNCKKYNVNKPIYRGMRGKNKSVFGIVEGQKGGRKSENTTNHYTVIMDEVIKSTDSKYPLRSKSIICSNSKDYAKRYGDVYNIIPFDDVVIGLVPEKDIWYVDLIGDYTFKDLNDYFNKFKIGDESISKIASSLKSLDASKYANRFESVFGKQDGDILAGIKKAFDLDHLGFKFLTQDKFSANTFNEMWIAGKCLVVKESLHDTLVKYYDEIISGDYELMYKMNDNDYYTLDDYMDGGEAVIVNKKFSNTINLNMDIYDKVDRDEFFGTTLKKYVKPNDVEEYLEYIADDSFTDKMDSTNASVAYFLRRMGNTMLSSYFNYSGIKIKYVGDIDVTYAFYKIDGKNN